MSRPSGYLGRVFQAEETTWIKSLSKEHASVSKCSKDTSVTGPQKMVLEEVRKEIGDKLREVRRQSEMMMGLLDHRIEFGFSTLS